MKLLASMLVGGWLVLSVPNAASAGLGADEKKPAAKVEGAADGAKVPAVPAAAPAKAPKSGQSRKKGMTGQEVTLEGTFGCAKCSFKEADACRNVLKVEEGGKQVTYEVASNEVAKQHHEEICHSAGKAASISGTVSEAAGKKTVTPTAIKLAPAP